MRVGATSTKKIENYVWTYNILIKHEITIVDKYNDILWYSKLF